MSNPALGHIQIVDAHELWKDEARDFTPWLTENARQLSEAIGIPIEIDGTEKEVGDFYLDISYTIRSNDKNVFFK
ncbi:MAG: hypothetical protein K9I68_03680 [Bacteroidales bacterium]|nr:hypothetical protein [Bacteroidales bacterium]MCF8336956.1 hypothetical protein [Bacteroidales bacterium]